MYIFKLSEEDYAAFSKASRRPQGQPDPKRNTKSATPCPTPEEEKYKGLGFQIGLGLCILAYLILG